MKLENVILFILAGSWLGMASCSKGEDSGTEETQVQASFTLDDVVVYEGNSVLFTNTSVNAEAAYYWDFGDGEVSVQEHPEHIYTTVGNYIVTLTVIIGDKEAQAAKEVKVYRTDEVPGREQLVTYLQNHTNKLMVCAHRMYHEQLPENSMAALQASVDEGIGMIEIDVRQTKDGELVVIHDATLNRTSTGSGNVSDFLWDELQQFYLYKTNGSLSNEHIPSLKKVLLAARGKLYIDLDVKIENYIQVYNLVKQYGMLTQCMFTVDELSVCHSLQNTDAETILFPIVRSTTAYAEYTGADLNINIFQLNAAMLQTPEVTNAIVNANKFIFGNIYVNSSVSPQSNNYNQVTNFINLGGTIIQTDYPVAVKAYLQNLNLN